MYCKRIEVENFRNIEKAEIDFSDGVNILVGENAQGKTNLLEAIFFSSVGRSFRTPHSNELIRFGESYGDVLLTYRDSSRENKIHLKIMKDKQKLVEKNGLKMDKLSDIVGSFRSVLFCPEHLSLIKEGPHERRGYMDVAISRLYPMYIHSLQRYAYFLKQRNALIKNAIKDRATFDATVELWTEKLADEASTIASMRYKYVKRAEKHIVECFSEMTGDRERPTVIYDGSSGQIEEEYLDKEKTRKKYFELLMTSHEREILAGTTLFGIHKDDIDIRLNGNRARNYASQGQQRSLALAMKLAEGEICCEEYGDHPVFLFDDVLSELDEGRRDYLLNRIEGKQVIMTTCEIDSMEKISGAKKIEVKSGSYKEI
ncbi:MAG: DNA replication/repair protein RecF [Clostridia bacterium]|nr:DNA replication/repair protein RecF [Clostridia bacterium]